MAGTPNKRNKMIHGIEVEQVQLQNKWYTPVDGRVKIAQHADPALIRRDKGGYKVIDVQFVQMGDKWAYFCMVEYPIGSGVTVPGSDFIDLKDPSGVAKAETSAIGRALGLHGIASEEGIASAEEARRVTREPQEEGRQGAHLQVVQNPEKVATGGDIAQFKHECEDAGVTWREMVVWLPAHRNKTVNQLTYGDLAGLRQMLKENRDQFLQEGA